MIRPIIKPPALRPGDRIGIISPSDPIVPERLAGLQRGMDLLRDIGFEPVLAPNAQKSLAYMAGSVAERVDDIHACCTDTSIKAIMCSWGGKSCNQLLEHLDYQLIAAHPTIISGFSDPTNLLNAIFSQTGLVTFHGPHMVAALQPIGKTVDWFLRAVSGGALGVLESAAEMTMIKPGQATGRLVGGNLSCFDLGLLGTPYQPDLQGAIWFWETGTNRPEIVDQHLTHYRLCGVFDRISAMVIGELGEPVVDKAWKQRSTEDIVLQATDGFDFPILWTRSFGHGPVANWTLPIGCQARVDADAQLFEVLESGVEAT